MPASHPLTRTTRWGLIIFGLLTVGYIYIYQQMPLPEGWNDSVLNFSIAIAAFAGAITSSFIWTRFEKGESPRSIWRPFAWGLWLWATAELCWAASDMFIEIPDISPIDIPWVAAFAPLGVSLLRQFRLVYSPTPQVERKWLMLTLGGVAGGAILTTLALHLLAKQADQAWYETLLLVFYPFADLALAIPAILLARLFGRGLWGRAWIGLLVMAVSDAIYSVLVFSGIYASSAEQGNLLSLLADVSYFDAYLLLALFCVVQWVLLRYGPPPAASRSLS